MPVAADNNSSENKKTLNLTIKGGRVNKKTPRSLILPPCLELGGNTLYIIDYVPSCTLQLVDETGNIFYETIIPEGTECWELPTDQLAGCELRLIPEGTECWELPTDQLAGCELRLIIDDVCYYCIL